MAVLTRRSVLQSTLGIATAGALSRPFIANAAATTITIWWVQGFAKQEDISIQKIVADYEKLSGDTVNLVITPYAPLRQKIVVALTSGGEVPDVFQNTPNEMLAIHAWDDRLVDVSDVVETQRSKYIDSALLFANCYNKVTKQRSFYGAPYSVAGLVNHIWRSLVEKAGRKVEDLPKTWDAYYDSFKGMQKTLREMGMRNTYSMGFTLSTTGNDSNNQFNYFLNAYGGQGLVTPDGRLHIDDPQVREAAIKALSYTTTAYKEGYIPKSAVNWNDSDNNNAFHSKLLVMDLDGTISTEVAIIDKKDDYDDIVTQGIVFNNDGKPIPGSITCNCGMVPKGAKNIAGAKQFLKYLVQPEISNEYLKGGLGRNIPAMKSIVENDPWWFADPHRKAYVTEGLLSPTMPDWFAYNPAYAQVRSEHVWGLAWGNILRDNMAPKEAAEKAFKRVGEIFAGYQPG
ncbi:MAG TPA: ABC transporter substrate-binding protein [Stellaceae bacterium]|nr:ABC transporter substrate-binding protein [Stellaceae bacterium]